MRTIVTPTRTSPTPSSKTCLGTPAASAPCAVRILVFFRLWSTEEDMTPQMPATALRQQGMVAGQAAAIEARVRIEWIRP
jgi:hypothetical protein